MSVERHNEFELAGAFTRREGTVVVECKSGEITSPAASAGGG